MTLAQTIALTSNDWLGIVGLVLAQTVSLGAILWKFASRMQRLETNLENLTQNVTEDIQKRVTRLENLRFGLSDRG
jgi:hypothetical protein